MELRSFIHLLKKYKYRLSMQQFRTLKGQAVSGDVAGARKGLHTLIERKII